MKKRDIDEYFSKNYGKLLRKCRKLKSTVWGDKRAWLTRLEEEDIVAFYYIYCCRNLWDIKSVEDIDDEVYSNEFMQFLKFNVPLRYNEFTEIDYDKIDEELEKYRGSRE